MVKIMCDGDCFDRERLVQVLVDTLQDGKRIKGLIYELSVICMAIDRGEYVNPIDVKNEILKAMVRSNG